MAFKSKAKKAVDLFQTGAKAAGTVLAVQDTGATVNDNPRVKMTFRIEPLDGSAAFDVAKTRTVSRVEIPRRGERYPVWFDPENHDEWAYAMIDDDNGRATMRELFGDVAETFVGMGGAAAPAAAAPTAAEQLKILADLHASGALTDEEFASEKAKLLS
jgi:Short C-terminal domain